MVPKLHMILVAVIIITDVTDQQVLLQKPDNCPKTDNERDLKVLRELTLKNQAKQEEMINEISELKQQFKLLQKSNLQPTTTTSTTTRPTTNKLAPCNPPWLQYEEFCFFISSKKEDWKAAAENCRQMNAELAAFETKDKNDFMGRKIISSNDYWIGGNDLDKEGDWRWKKGNKKIGPYTNWYANDPDGRTGQNCMWFNYQNTQQWIDAPCSRSLNFICERNI